jgi:Na+-transporting NADH:ubiquinone oxidoreductase subunit NqrD
LVVARSVVAAVAVVLIVGSSVRSAADGRWLLAVAGFMLVGMAIAGWTLRLIEAKRARNRV